MDRLTVGTAQGLASKGIWPTRLCVAQPKQGSHARKAIATMLSSPSATIDRVAYDGPELGD